MIEKYKCPHGEKFKRVTYMNEVSNWWFNNIEANERLICLV